MKAFVHKLKPANGFAHFIHIGLNLLLPILLFVLVRIRFYQLGFLLLLLSKWRMFAVRPRHWPVHFRVNAVDLMVGCSVIVFMSHSGTAAWQLVWAILFGTWLIFIKPRDGIVGVAAQALIGQIVALMAVFLAWGGAPLVGLVAITWLICYLSARHFFTSFDEEYGGLYAHVWGYFGGALTWVLAHWLLFYGTVSQPTLILSVLALGLGSLYYLNHTDRLSSLIRRQFVITMVAVIMAVLVLSDWSSKIF
ncbi:MAG: hypothetical protein NVSMB37_4050 [Candidatus Saccharimonadales bacterium]